jgi:hypothetical protein
MSKKNQCFIVIFFFLTEFHVHGRCHGAENSEYCGNIKLYDISIEYQVGLFLYTRGTVDIFQEIRTVPRTVDNRIVKKNCVIGYTDLLPRKATQSN